jgi:hypothetical protein
MRYLFTKRAGDATVFHASCRFDVMNQGSDQYGKSTTQDQEGSCVYTEISALSHLG